MKGRGKGKENQEYRTGHCAQYFVRGCWFMQTHLNGGAGAHHFCFSKERLVFSKELRGVKFVSVEPQG